jgi:signal transduction histidine kinase
MKKLATEIVSVADRADIWGMPEQADKLLRAAKIIMAQNAGDEDAIDDISASYDEQMAEEQQRLADLAAQKQAAIRAEQERQRLEQQRLLEQAETAQEIPDQTQPQVLT